MKTSIVILGLILAGSACAQESDSAIDFRAEYDAGVEYFEQGELRAASDALLEAISISPSPSDAIARDKCLLPRAL